MVEWPDIVCGLVGIGAYARMVSEGGTYHPVCIWLLFKSSVPGCSRVGKVGLKVGLKQLSMQDMLQDLAHWALWVWVQDKSRLRHKPMSKVSLIGLCHGASPPSPIHARQTGHQPLQQQWVTSSHPAQNSKELACSPTASFSTTPSSSACSAPSTSIGPSPRGQGRAFLGWLYCLPPWNLPARISSWTVGQVLAPAPPLLPHPAHTRRPPPPPSSSSAASALAYRGGISKTL